MSVRRLATWIGVMAAMAAGLVQAGCTLPTALTKAERPALVEATVQRTVDGDTAVFRLADGRSENVRFIGIDTPESTKVVETYGREAAAYTSLKLKPSTRVYLELDVEERDRYGRLLAYVWLERPDAVDDGEIRAKMLNARLALDGYAQQMTVPPNVRYAEQFGEYVREAREAQRGLWAAAQPPAETAGDGGTVQELGSGYIGNRRSMKFHQTQCSSVGEMNPTNKVPLGSREEAIRSGYEPCGRCDP